MAWKYDQNEMDPITPSRGIDLLTAKGGVRPPAAMFATGNNPAMQAADGVNSTAVVTEIYVGTIIVPFTCLCTGIAHFNGSDVTDKVKSALFDANGALLRTTAAAGTQCSGADAYQLVPFALGPDGITSATTIVLPTGTYYVGCIYNGVTSRFNAHGIGAYPTRRVTGAVFATAFNTTSLTITPPTAFAITDLSPIASLY